MPQPNPTAHPNGDQGRVSSSAGMAGGSNKPSVRTFIVLVDTNTIWTSEDDLTRVDLMPPDFQRKWEAIAAGGDVTLMVPQVVLGELAYQKTKALSQAYNQGRAHIQTVRSTLGIRGTEVEQLRLDQLGEKVQQKLLGQVAALPRCAVADTPVDAVAARIGSIIQASIWRRAPFESGKSEKGFRDAVILETVRSIQIGRPHADVALITRDGRLDAAAKADVLPGSSNFGVFSDLDSYARFLELARGRFTPERLHAISNNAELRFQQGWAEHGMEDRFRVDYDLGIGSTAFETAKGAAAQEKGIGGIFSGYYGAGITALGCVGEPQFKFLGTRLLSVVGSDEFHWATAVTAVAPYTERPGMLALLSTSDDVKGEPTRYRGILTDVEWSARVNEKDQLSGFRVIDKRTRLDRFYPTATEATAVAAMLS